MNDATPGWADDVELTDQERDNVLAELDRLKNLAAEAEINIRYYQQKLSKIEQYIAEIREELPVNGLLEAAAVAGKVWVE